MNKLPISAIVVSRNEGHLLENCLMGIQFCAEIVVIDLQSTDNTREISSRLATRCVSIEPIPVVEIIHEKFVPQLSNKWVLLTDPDEVCSYELQEEIRGNFLLWDVQCDVGAIIAPLRYYFRNHLLKGTPWGGVNSRHLIIQKDRFTLSSHIHQGRRLKNGFKFISIPFTGMNFIHHYWMTGYRQFLKKHLRYLKKEGEARYMLGQRTRWKEILHSPRKEFIYSFKIKEGRKDGFLGFGLSLFWAWYQTMALYRLRKFQVFSKNN